MPLISLLGEGFVTSHARRIAKEFVSKDEAGKSVALVTNRLHHRWRSGMCVKIIAYYSLPLEQRRLRPTQDCRDDDGDHDDDDVDDDDDDHDDDDNDEFERTMITYFV